MQNVSMAITGPRLHSAFCILHSAFLLLLLAGCQPSLETTYGQRQGPMASSSVNGTAVLAEMFERAGHRVLSWHKLSPRLRERADCIVWIPDDFEPPSSEVRQWLEDWLEAAPGRTLVYVGRDFDAAAWYWKKVEPGTPKDQLAQLRKRKATALADFQTERKKLAKDTDGEWFTAEPGPKPREVHSLQGEPSWLQGIDPAQLEIELNGRIIPSPEANVVLESEGDMLVSVEPFDESQLIVVANGSFLLNLPLVNHAHRQLAGHLIDQVGEPKQTVVFLESRDDGPPIVANDPAPSVPTGLEIFNLWPTSWILLHLVVVGILLCFSRYPIFGLPRDLPPEAPSDFGKHVEALGELLSRSGDTAYATARILHYRQSKTE
jgi:hypothetical protein